jgi:hypothetical protein
MDGSRADQLTQSWPRRFSIASDKYLQILNLYGMAGFLDPPWHTWQGMTFQDSAAGTDPQQLMRVSFRALSAEKSHGLSAGSYWLTHQDT